VSSLSTPHTNRAAVRTIALLGAVACAGAVYALWRFFVGTKMGQLIEQSAFHGSLYGRTRLWTIAEPILNAVSVAYVAVAILVVVAIALLRKRWMLAVQVVTVIVGANVTTQLTKKLIFTRPDLDVGWSLANSLPSGHTTVAASVSLALLIAVPRFWRPIVALFGAGFSAAMGISTLVGQWHRPADVYAALCVSAGWALIVCAFATSSTHDSDPRRSKAWTAAIIAILSVVTCAGILGAAWFLRDAFISWDTAHIDSPALQKNTYIGSVLAVGGLSSLIFGATLVIRQAVARMR